MADFVLIGGSGTLGRELTRQILAGKKGSVLCFSRGEHAQKRLAAEFPEVDCQIGDVRDPGAVREALRGAGVVMLLAAIKHVDVAEKNPLEAMKTNVIGAVNVAEEAIEYGIKHVVFSNTDKSCLPITTYGYTKALAQNYLLQQNGKGFTKFSSFCWGNIVGSQGSAIPIFVEKLLTGTPVPVTDARMSRFWLKIEDVARFMLESYEKASLTAPMIPPVRGAKVVSVVASIARILGIKNYEIETIGARGTEKIYEVLESSHVKCLRSDNCKQFSDAELDGFLRPVVLEAAGRLDRLGVA